jgi:hypothetical protein
MMGPRRTARENPIVDSNGEPEEIRRSEVGMEEKGMFAGKTGGSTQRAGMLKAESGQFGERDTRPVAGIEVSVSAGEDDRGHVAQITKR